MDNIQNISVQSYENFICLWNKVIFSKCIYLEKIHSHIINCIVEKKIRHQIISFIVCCAYASDNSERCVGCLKKEMSGGIFEPLVVPYSSISQKYIELDKNDFIMI